MFTTISILFYIGSVYDQYDCTVTRLAAQSLKSMTYSAYYNHTNNTQMMQAMQTKFNQTEERTGRISSEISKSFPVSSISEVGGYIFVFNLEFLNAMGVNIRPCWSSNSGDCYSYVKDETVYCLADMMCEAYNLTSTFGKILQTNNTQMIEGYINEHPVERMNGCPRPINISTIQTLHIFGGMPLLENANTTVTSTLMILYTAVLFAEGYLISCIIFWLYYKLSKKKPDASKKKREDTLSKLLTDLRKSI